MARTFAYCRVSTLGQTVENQIREIEAAGFAVEKQRLITAIEPRPGFMKLFGGRMQRPTDAGAAFTRRAIRRGGREVLLLALRRRLRRIAGGLRWAA